MSLKRVRIRMYRGILGDCFLVRATVMEAGNEIVRSMLIDCGVLQSVPAGHELIEKLSSEVVEAVGRDRLGAVRHGPTRIREVLRDVLREVGGRIDLLVITHEHYDHLSGFAFGKDDLANEGVSIGRLWMAWTEKPDDPQAQRLRARFSKGRQALTAAVQLAEGLGADAPAGLREAAALADFVGPLDAPGLAASSRMGTGQMIQMLKDKTGSGSTDYLEPGQVVPLAGFGMTAYVLGPPRLEEMLEKDAPSSGEAKEVYLTRFDAAAAAESTAWARVSSLSKAKRKGIQAEEPMPFAQRHRRLAPSRKKQVKSGWGETTRSGVRSLYYSASADWRSIDEEWVGSIEAMALKMDSDTNNTSLALAFELPDGQVLLFPGDAQVGNWLSWNSRPYPHPMPDGGHGRQVSAEDLLRRTTFYKAGHHASHNATLKALGLERMTDPRLVAAIPVVEALAAVQGKGRREVGKGWKMPYGDLYATLVERTKGRIVRGDGDVVEESEAFRANPTSADKAVTVAHGDLWVELTFELG